MATGSRIPFVPDRSRLCFYPRSNFVSVALLLVAWQSTTAVRAAGPEPQRTKLAAGKGGKPFDDVRPDAMLVGLRVTVDQVMGRFDVICSVQPIYRQSNGDVVRGEMHGAGHGLELVSEAKPGYAVGRIVVSYGDRIDGLRCIFMRERDGKLIPDDHYEGRWLGGLSDKPSEEIGRGTAPMIGVHGRVEGEIRAVGLLLPPDKAEK